MLRHFQPPTPYAPSASPSQPLCRGVGWSTTCIPKILLHHNPSCHTDAAQNVLLSHICRTCAWRKIPHHNVSAVSTFGLLAPFVTTSFCFPECSWAWITTAGGVEGQWHTLCLEGAVPYSRNRNHLQRETWKSTFGRFLTWLGMSWDAKWINNYDVKWKHDAVYFHLTYITLTQSCPFFSLITFTLIRCWV